MSYPAQAASISHSGASASFSVSSHASVVPVQHDSRILALVAELREIQTMLPASDNSAHCVQLRAKMKSAMNSLEAIFGRPKATSGSSHSKSHISDYTQRIDLLRIEILALTSAASKPQAKQTKEHREFCKLTQPLADVAIAIEVFLNTNQLAGSASKAENQLSTASALNERFTAVLTGLDAVKSNLTDLDKQSFSVVKAIILKQQTLFTKCKEEFVSMRLEIERTITWITSKHCNKTGVLKKVTSDITSKAEQIPALIMKLEAALSAFHLFTETFTQVHAVSESMSFYQKESQLLQKSFLDGTFSRHEIAEIVAFLNQSYSDLKAQMDRVKEALATCDAFLQTFANKVQGNQELEQEVSEFKKLLQNGQAAFLAQYNKIIQLAKGNAIIRQAPADDMSSLCTNLELLTVEVEEFNHCISQLRYDFLQMLSYPEVQIRDYPGMFSRINQQKVDIGRAIDETVMQFKKLLTDILAVKKLQSDNPNDAPAEEIPYYVQVASKLAALQQKQALLDQQLLNIDMHQKCSDTITGATDIKLAIADAEKLSLGYAALDPLFKKYFECQTASDAPAAFGTLKMQLKTLQGTLDALQIAHRAGIAAYEDVCKFSPADQVDSSKHPSVFKQQLDRLNISLEQSQKINSFYSALIEALAEGATIVQETKRVNQECLLDRSNLKATMMTDYAFNPKPNENDPAKIKAHITLELSYLEQMLASVENENTHEVQLKLDLLTKAESTLSSLQKSLQQSLQKLAIEIGKDTDQARQLVRQQYVDNLSMLCPALQKNIEQEKVKLELVASSQYFSIQLIKYARQFQLLRNVRKFEKEGTKHQDALKAAEEQFKLYSQEFVKRGLNPASQPDQDNEMWDGSRFESAYHALMQKCSFDGSQDPSIIELGGALRSRSEVLWKASAGFRDLIMPDVKIMRYVMSHFGYFNNNYMTDFTQSYSSHALATARETVGKVYSAASSVAGSAYSAATSLAESASSLLAGFANLAIGSSKKAE